MASVAMEAPVGIVEKVLEPAASPALNGYRLLEPGRVAGLHIPEIEAVAEELARELEYKPGKDLHLTVEKLGGELLVYDPGFDESRFSGLLVGEEFGSFRILLPARSSLPHENVIIAKELGHYFLHHLYSRAKVPSDTPQQGETTDPVTLSNSEAEVFALCFLMPKADLRRDIDLGTNIAKLASHYGIPETIVRKRMHLLERGESGG